MPIATYVFLDLKSSGLPGDDHGEVQITELCMLAVKRLHLLQPGKETPRVQYKLRMCFNPQKKVDQTTAAKTGLNLSLLKYETHFDRDVFNAINSFIRCLEKPICLISQNALKFHFQLLKYHFNKIQVSLSDDILCTDSSYAFYDILKGESSTIHSCDVVSTRKKKNSKPRKFCELWREEFENLNPIDSEDKLLEDYRQHAEDSEFDNKLKIEGAEYQCTVILKLAKVRAQTFSKWVEENHCPFSEVPTMVM